MAVLSVSGQQDKFSTKGEIVEKKGKSPVAFDDDYKIETYSAAIEYKKELVSNLDIILGYSHHWQDKEDGKDDNKGSYMIGTSYKVSDSTTLRASFANKIRFPSIKQLYDVSSGNKDLKPEESKNYEAGISQKLFWDMTLDIALFLNDVEDYIEKNDATDLNENNDEYRFKGVEINLVKQICENGSIGLGYTYLDSEDKSPGAQRDELQYRPKHKITANASYKWDFGLTAYADFMHFADQYYYSSDLSQKGKLDDFSIVNLKVEQQLCKDNLFVFFGIDNVFNKLYERSYGFPEEGRKTYVGVRISY